MSFSPFSILVMSLSLNVSKVCSNASVAALTFIGLLHLDFSQLILRAFFVFLRNNIRMYIYA